MSSCTVSLLKSMGSSRSAPVRAACGTAWTGVVSVSLLGGQPAVDGDGDAGDVAGVVAGEEGDDGGDLLGLGTAAERDSADEVLGQLGDVGSGLTAEELGEHGGLHGAGADHVDTDAVGGALEGEGAGEGDEGSLGHRVEGAEGGADERRGGGGHGDRPLALGGLEQVVYDGAGLAGSLYLVDDVIIL